MKSVSEPVLARELVHKWGTMRENESMATRSGRISVLRQFALFLTSLGMDAYIPSHFFKAEKAVVHILSDEEIRAVFRMIDNYVPELYTPAFHRLAAEYKVIFRLIYCCGLRISEARKLKWKDVGLKEGTIRILQSKGHKDRLVYLADDMAELLRLYVSALRQMYHCGSEWVFPAREPEKCLSNVTLGAQFRKSWGKTPYAESCDKAPTVHCLRHTFVVKRMNLWMEEGLSLNEMMSFLCRYLGHTSPDETLYYYHQVDSAFRIIRDRDKAGRRIIPEVWLDE